MESGYKIVWTDHALKELADTYEYLELNFTEKELKKLSTAINQVLQLISKTQVYFHCLNLKEYEELVLRNTTQCIIESTKKRLKFYLFSLTDKTLTKGNYSSSYNNLLFLF